MTRAPCQLAGIVFSLLSLVATDAEARRLTASRPLPAALVTRSSAKMVALHSVHTSATVSLWSSGTQGNHIPVTVRMAITGDCSKAAAGRVVMYATRFHAVGERTVGGRRTNTIDARYITIARGVKGATGSGSGTLRVWKRSPQTHRIWRKLAAPPVQELAYSLGDSAECPNDQTIRLVTPARFTYAGTFSLGGRPSWRLHGTLTRGDTTDVQLYVDQQSGLWNRIATTFIIRNKGTIVNRLHSTINYSRSNVPVRIAAPTP